MKNIEHKIQILQENCKGLPEKLELREYVEREAENDPGFFTWLFDEDVSDFGKEMTDKQKEEYESFLNILI